jgi:hypothetical protein
MFRYGLVLAASAMLVLAGGAVTQVLASGAIAGAGDDSDIGSRGPTLHPDAPMGLPRGKSKAPAGPSKEEMVKQAIDIVSSIGLPCVVSDANLLGEGKANVNGQMLDTKNFEVVCNNGLGYLLSSSPPQKPSGYSCIAADHTHARDVASGQQSPTCSLPANGDVRASAGNALSRLGTACQVTGVNWIGANASNEFTEIACTGGRGYVLTSARPGGSTSPPSAMTCVDAIKSGITCKLSSSGPPPLTLDTFKNSLAQYHVPCNATNLHSLGKETGLKRHLIEYQCPAEHPEGLVALIPLQDSSAPFETLSCAQATARYRVFCAYVKP